MHDRRDTVADFKDARAKYRELKTRLGAADVESKDGSMSLDLDKQVEMVAWESEDYLYRHYIGGRTFNGQRNNIKLTAMLADFVLKHVRLDTGGANEVNE